MTIAAVSGQSGGATGTGASISRAFGSNVSVGSLLTIIGWRYEPATEAYVAGDCTKSAGTATIDTPTLDASLNLSDGDGNWMQVGIWSCLVTGAGSLTMQVAGGTGTGAPSIATHEFTGSWDSGRVDGTPSTNSTTTNDTTNAHSGDTTSTGAALFIGGLVVSQLSTTISVTPDGAFTQIYEYEAGGTSEVGSAIYRIVGTGTTDRAEWTIATGSTGWCAGVVAYKEADSSTKDQEGFAFGDDNGNEAAHTLGTQDADYTGPLGTKTLRFLLDVASGDPPSIAYRLRAQKNGAGGYAEVAVGATTKPTPVIESGDCTVSGSNTAQAGWAVSRPAYASGALVILYIAWDDSTTTTDATEPAGPNGETLLEINATPVTDSSTETRAKAWYYVATNAQGSAGTLTFTPSATESWSATCIVVPPGEFDPTTPIGAFGTSNATTGTDTTVDSPAFSAGSSDGGGRLVWCAGVDADPLGGTNPTGWTIRQTQDLGAVAHGVATRDTAVTDSESIASATWAIAGDSWTSIAFVVRAPTITNEVYVSASANVTAGGEATTARLTPPSGKSTSDFVTGRRWDDENGTDTIDITAVDYTEVEWVLTTQSPAVNGDYFDFRVYAGSSALTTYGFTPRWTLGTSGIAVAQVTETDTAQTITASQAREVGQVTETGTAQAITYSATAPLTQVVETDTAQPFSALTPEAPRQRRAPRALLSPYAGEAPVVLRLRGVPAVLRLAAPITVAVAQVTETDTAQPITGSQARAVDQVTETDSAQAITAQRVLAVGQVTETDTAQEIAGQHVGAVTQVTETDTAQTIGALQALSAAQVIETDAAQSITARLAAAVGQTIETDTAQEIASSQPGTIGQVTETDTAQAITANVIQVAPTQRRAPRAAVNPRAGVPLATWRQRGMPVAARGQPIAAAVDQVTETDTAQPVTAITGLSIAQITETDTAQPIAGSQSAALAQTVETDMAQPITAGQSVAVEQTVETDTAQPLEGIQLVTVEQVLETDEALPIVRGGFASVDQVLELNIAQPITPILVHEELPQPPSGGGGGRRKPPWARQPRQREQTIEFERPLPIEDEDAILIGIAVAVITTELESIDG